MDGFLPVGLRKCRSRPCNAQLKEAGSHWRQIERHDQCGVTNHAQVAVPQSRRAGHRSAMCTISLTRLWIAEQTSNPWKHHGLSQYAGAKGKCENRKFTSSHIGHPPNQIGTIEFLIINTKANSYAGLFMLFPVSAMVSGSRVW